MTFSTGRGVVGATLVGLLLACALIAGNRYVGVSYRDVSQIADHERHPIAEDFDMTTVSWKHCPETGGEMTVTVTQLTNERFDEFALRVTEVQGTWPINCGEGA